MEEKNWLIGAASFGASYGLNNHQPLANDELGLLIEDTRNTMFSGFDTAPSYGRSETLLGSSSLQGFDLYSKIWPSQNLLDFDDLTHKVDVSLLNLGVKSLRGVGMHSPAALFEFGSAGERNLKELVDSGRAESWGVSVYTMDELLAVIDRFSPSFIQVPANILDRRFLDPNLIERLLSHGIETHVRSVFLQGLLLLDIEAIPPYLEPLRPALGELADLAKVLGLSAVELSVGYIANIPGVNSVVLGVNSRSQLSELDLAIRRSSSSNWDLELPSVTSDLIDPRTWTN
jgi:aryl-alcohol dehydrogenase-like predicted oxidoreductase